MRNVTVIVCVAAGFMLATGAYAQSPARSGCTHQQLADECGGNGGVDSRFAEDGSGGNGGADSRFAEEAGGGSGGPAGA